MAQDTRETNECRLHVAKEEFFLAGFALVLPKGAPYLHYFNHQIQWMIQTGITHYWKRKYWPAKNKCEAARKEQEAQRALGIDDVQGVFLLLGIGLAASGIAFIVEISIPCIQKKGNEERKRGTTEVARRGEVTTTKPGVVSYTQRTSY